MGHRKWRRCSLLLATSVRHLEQPPCSCHLPTSPSYSVQAHEEEDGGDDQRNSKDDCHDAAPCHVLRRVGPSPDVESQQQDTQDLQQETKSELFIPAISILKRIRKRKRINLRTCRQTPSSCRSSRSKVHRFS